MKLSTKCYVDFFSSLGYTYAIINMENSTNLKGIICFHSGFKAFTALVIN